MITARRKTRAQRGRSGDGNSQVRGHRYSNGQQRNLSDHNQPPDFSGSYNLRSNIMSYVNTRQKNSQENSTTDSTSSSENEDEDNFHITRNKIQRRYSDYESGESSDKTCRPTTSGMTNNQLKSNSSFTQQGFDLDSSSDDSVLSPRVNKNHKRPLSPTSTSDTSDSDRPISFKRPIKRMRVFSSSEGKSSDDELNSNHSVNSEPEGNINNSHITESSLAQNPSEENPYFRSRRSSIRMPVVESESESDALSENHTTTGRRISAMGSEDENMLRLEHNDGRYYAVSVQDLPHRVRLAVRRCRYTRRGTVENVWRVYDQAEETDDSGVPISTNRRVRGRRIPVVESEDESESDSTTIDIDSLIPNGNNEATNSLVLNSRRRRILCNNQRNTSSNNIGRRNIPLMQSDNESDTSDSVIRPRTLSNRMVPIFESGDSSSSSSTDSDGSIPIRIPQRRNRSIPIAEDYEDAPIVLPDFDVKIPNSSTNKGSGVLKNKLGNNSSDSDSEVEKCPICLVGFKLQEIGKPKTCDHKFCAVCIKEWASKNNSCPVDRKVFDAIVVYDKNEGKITNEIAVENTHINFNNYFELDGIEDEVVAAATAGWFTDSSDTSWYFESDEDGPEELCVVCRNNDQSHRMISCDYCNDVYHLSCVNPPLRAFPAINWYCSRCDGSFGQVFFDSD